MGNVFVTPTQKIVAFLAVLCAFVYFLPTGTAASGNKHRSTSKRSQTVLQAKAAAPLPIHYLDAQAQGKNVALNWGVATERKIEGFRVYRRASSENSFYLVNGDGLIAPWQWTYTDGDPEPATNYHYIVGLVLANGQEVLSVPADVTTNGASSFAAK